MTPSRGLRRFVSPDRPAPSGPPQSPEPGHDHDQDQSTAQSAAGLLPPLVAQLLEGAPPGALDPPGSAAPAPGAAAEKCELCATEIPAGHGHVADLENASLVCACRACYLLFTQSAAGRGRYRAVPDRYLSDPGPPLTAAEWDRLEIPVGLAFFFHSSAADRVAGFYPSPAGVTECVLDLGAWEQLGRDHPLLGAPAADVEAALISRTDGGIEAFVVPIDACYELAGRMRLHWRGFDGGAEARASIASFLDEVRSRARPFRASTVPDGD